MPVVAPGWLVLRRANAIRPWAFLQGGAPGVDGRISLLRHGAVGLELPSALSALIDREGIIASPRSRIEAIYPLLFQGEALMCVWTSGNHKKLLASNIRSHKQYHRKPHAARMQPPSSPPAGRCSRKGGRGGSGANQDLRLRQLVFGIDRWASFFRKRSLRRLGWAPLPRPRSINPSGESSVR